MVGWLVCVVRSVPVAECFPIDSRRESLRKGDDVEWSARVFFRREFGWRSLVTVGTVEVPEDVVADTEAVVVVDTEVVVAAAAADPMLATGEVETTDKASTD